MIFVAVPFVRHLLFVDQLLLAHVHHRRRLREAVSHQSQPESAEDGPLVSPQAPGHEHQQVHKERGQQPGEEQPSLGEPAHGDHQQQRD